MNSAESTALLRDENRSLSMKQRREIADLLESNKHPNAATADWLRLLISHPAAAQKRIREDLRITGDEQRQLAKIFAQD